MIESDEEEDEEEDASFFINLLSKFDDWSLNLFKLKLHCFFFLNMF